MKIRKIMAGMTAGLMCVSCITGCTSNEVKKGVDSESSKVEEKVVALSDVTTKIQEWETGNFKVALDMKEESMGNFGIEVEGETDQKNAAFNVSLNYEMLKDASDGAVPTKLDSHDIEIKVVDNVVYLNTPKIIALLDALGMRDQMGFDFKEVMTAEWLSITMDDMTDITETEVNIEDVLTEENKTKYTELIKDVEPIVLKLIEDTFGDVLKDIETSDTTKYTIAINKENIGKVFDAIVTAMENGTVDKALTDIAEKCASADEKIVTMIEDIKESYTNGGKEEIIKNLKEAKDKIQYFDKLSCMFNASIPSEDIVEIEIVGNMAGNSANFPNETTEVRETLVAEVEEDVDVDITVSSNMKLENKEVKIEAPTDVMTMDDLTNAINAYYETMYETD